jgi:microcompartment protein CcmK/EutM
MNEATQTNHFNLHLAGIGYLNRVRWVVPKQAGRKAQPFLACSVSALRGDSQSPDYTYLDLRVSGQEASVLIEKCMKDVDQRRKVVISFKVGDIYPHMYERQVKVDGQKTAATEMACLIKGRLLLVNTITIDGERVYSRQAEDDAVDPAPAGESEFSQEGEGFSAGDDSQEPSEEEPFGVAQVPLAPPRHEVPTMQPRPSFSSTDQGVRDSIAA